MRAALVALGPPERGTKTVLRFSKKMLFAIEAVLDIAYHAGTEPVQSREITRRQNIPQRYLEQALQQLVRENILTGIRGPKGGYRLARERRRITVRDIVRAVRKTESSDDPIKDTESWELGQKVVRPLWVDLWESLMDKLDDVTIEAFCKKAADAGIASENKKKLDFTI